MILSYLNNHFIQNLEIIKFFKYSKKGIFRKSLLFKKGGYAKFEQKLFKEFPISPQIHPP